jgi:hypothetical protein
MFARLLWFICSVAFLASASAAVIAPVPVTGKIQWVYSYLEGQKLARETGKPLFVVFRCER